MNAPLVALVLFALFGILGFGWRSWLQHRRTGSAGFRGVSGELGSAEWLAGAGFALSILIAVAAPVLQWAGVLAPVSFLDAEWIQSGGVLLAVFGIFGTVYAQVDMGESWRIGVDPDERTELVESGIFGRVRNPIFTAMLVFGAGIALVTPNMLALTGFALLVVTIEMQVRIVEEPYLEAVHGEVYRRYAAKVGRFIPSFGRIPPSE
ncbi:methyltransferase family protein [Mycolicibacterium brumae]|uniref:Isoprenylcysteine carboxylmethyltransferase family protein n=1 Tax=Mycolicibacterium brumae TaxID=85968 RepID=A0A2G5P5T3_9MYCO|nr:isoprenylcysteine carboxylmethyltransferase family protein [Mycolicibacterium brumae]MCV7191525.1 isoprenylcysteine carboxylmethyltransferase family protein [Mycolicibacterium brumae]PIB73627.1 isoprenylcysteine carboxylmethyltransferase family protein [Mycolicibacterium brumae]RWA16239.1 hypothetical protein MBRU_09015 [Mycolicibacterium brumae DSM 44177]UWW09368.1 isoprenylcysteine carboxylmethyltransferase family protein [Mycolicibacterium brumae]